VSNRFGRGIEKAREIMGRLEEVEYPPMQRAADWAAHAPVDDLKAYIIAAYRALPFEDRVRFLNYVGGGGRGQ
jgi:hypothetical protein